jgi:hypothetical protein
MLIQVQKRKEEEDQEEQMIHHQIEILVAVVLVMHLNKL